MRPAADSRLLHAISVYFGAVLLGLTLVSFPASSAFLRASTGISDVAYGSIYLSQLVTGILGALLGGVAVRRIGLRGMYLITLAFFALSQILLASSAGANAGVALILLMCATACFGFGFGFGGGPLNAFLPLLFPRRANVAIVALHMSAGAGLTIGPFLIAMLATQHRWLAAPMGLCALATLLFLLTLCLRLPAAPGGGPAASLWPEPGRTSFFWGTAAMALLYSIAEAMFSNWCVLYLVEEKQIPLQVAALALTCFWGSLTIGRLLVSVGVLWIRPLLLLLTLPVLIAVAFVVVSDVHSTATAILGFALAGFACSGFFPLLVGVAVAPFPRDVSWIASMLTAAMTVGVGIGSYAIGALHHALSITTLYRYSIIYPVALLMLLIALRIRPRAILAARAMGPSN